MLKKVGFLLTVALMNTSLSFAQWVNQGAWSVNSIQLIEQDYKYYNTINNKLDINFSQSSQITEVLHNNKKKFDAPFVSLVVNYPGIVSKSISHVVTEEDNLGLNAGNNVWRFTGVKSGDFPFIFLIKINNETIYHGFSTFDFERVLNVADTVELIFDTIINVSNKSYNTSWAKMEINIY